jgi:hypothetical protein
MKMQPAERAKNFICSILSTIRHEGLFRHIDPKECKYRLLSEGGCHRTLPSTTTDSLKKRFFTLHPSIVKSPQK